MGFNGLQNRVTDVERFEENQRSFNVSTFRGLERLNRNQEQMFGGMQSFYDQQQKINQGAIQACNGLQSRTTALEKFGGEQRSFNELASRSISVLSNEQKRLNRDLHEYYDEQQIVNRATAETYSGLGNRTTALENYAQQQLGINESSCRSIAKLGAKQKKSSNELVRFYAEQQQINQASLEALNRMHTRTDALEAEQLQQRSINESHSKSLSKISSKQKRLAREAKSFIEGQNRFNQSAADTLKALQARMDADGRKQSSQMQQLVEEQSRVNEETEERCNDLEVQVSALKDMVVQLSVSQLGQKGDGRASQGRARNRRRTKKTMKSRKMYYSRLSTSRY